jgi:transcriptional regulator with XRE-family HTH domain
MHISEFISQYLYKNKLSQRQFAKDCGLSNGYISMLINNVNPRTGKPLVPSLTALIALAKGMKITVDELIAQTDDIDVDITLARNIPKRINEENSPEQTELSEGEKIWLSLYNRLSEEAREAIITTASALEQLPAESQKIFLSMLRGALGSQA